ncbi:hypothetical protein GA0070609_2242 [Micromonospora echinaurantiaca]|uniref:Uncharacterized protein n=1 Tax=Micromonospora echinaurantiaca TaxID=47857 RepID=A0A1C5HUD6_9ACTN|nr:hypothetical protein [Micromonospora echinaurantiaca]SCG49513.1 hypothetical protein GA0070609_2242 [Micromonospora echinaurantiaca]
MTMWMLFGGVAVLILGAFAWVGWRDRRRLSGPDDTRADRDARAGQHAYEVQRHASPGQEWSARNDTHGPG